MTASYQHRTSVRWDVAGGACVVCLGDGWTTEPGPTAIGRRP